jgi:NADH-dependent peroxiredoxin subunit F
LLYDLAVLGAGPAGLSAAIYASRKLLKICVVSKDIGGQILLTSNVENYLGFELITAPELVQKFEDQVNQFNFDQFLGEKTQKLERKGETYIITTDQGNVLEAKSVVIATGKRSRQLGAKGEREFSGKGVSYCSTCDGPFFKDLPVAVVGGGNSAFEAALDMLKLCPAVYLINISPTWQGDEIYQSQVLTSPKLTALPESSIKEIRGDEKVRSILVQTPAGENEIKVGAVFVEVGLTPNSDFVKGFLEMNRAGEIVVDCACKTSMPGVFAAGDVTTVVEKQIIVAAGEGAKAALGAYRWLLINQKF